MGTLIKETLSDGDVLFFTLIFFSCKDVLFKCSIFTVLQTPNEGHFTGSKRFRMPTSVLFPLQSAYTINT